MSRELMVHQVFLEESHVEKIRETAERYGFTAHFFTGEQTEEAMAFAPECEVIYGQSPALAKAGSGKLKWFCCSSAGADAYCEEGVLSPECILTNSAGAYGVTIAEHIVMFTLMLMRQMPRYLSDGAKQIWTRPQPVSSILGGEFTLLGAGNIGTTAARRLKAMGAAKITGVSRSGKARDAVFDEMYPVSRLNEVLPKTKVLIMSLPNTAETDTILSREAISLLPEGAFVINVGRGTAVDQEALIEALESGALGGAAVDVTVPEPLPADHPLWHTKNLILTPHISGNFTLKYTRDTNVDMFCRDLDHYGRGEPMEHVVDRTLRY